MSSESSQREQMVLLARSLFERGLTPGSSGNLSMRAPDGGFLVTPTNASLGFLDPNSLAKLDADGNWVNGDKPTKEAFLHLAMYKSNSRTQSVSHLHSTYSVCLSCMNNVNAENLITPHTPYLQMRVGSLHDAVFAIEELEESAKIALLLQDRDSATLSAEQLAELDAISLKA